MTTIPFDGEAIALLQSIAILAVRLQEQGAADAEGLRAGQQDIASLVAELRSIDSQLDGLLKEPS